MIKLVSNKVDDFAENITNFLVKNELVKIKKVPYPEKLNHPPLNGEILILEQLSNLLTEKELKYYGRSCR